MTFEDALDALASEDAFKIDTPGAAAFACAGPVLDNKCVMTNLEWIIDGQSLTVKYGIRYAHLITLQVSVQQRSVHNMHFAVLLHACLVTILLCVT